MSKLMEAINIYFNAFKMYIVNAYLLTILGTEIHMSLNGIWFNT